jgi:hypothetical protein
MDRQKFSEKFLAPAYDGMLFLSMIFAATILGAGAIFIPILLFKYLTKAIC